MEVNSITAFRMKIIDCFIFYNELELLTYRLHLLNEVVDYFVLVESTHTFIGKEKELIFQKNKHLFEKFNHKIIHIVVEDVPYKLSNQHLHRGYQWTNEFHQRNCIDRGVQKLDLEPEDSIIISDLDEIPDPRILCRIKNRSILVSVNILEMDFYYYNLRSRINTKWILCKILTVKHYRQLALSPNDIRNYNCSRISNGGWHLSYFGDTKFIKNKLEQFSHQEYNKEEFTNEHQIQKRINSSSDLFGRNNNPINTIELKDNTYLPLHYEKYLTKFLS
jgi:beta-1,4-mannosyl-glycoprotein beta-1,4-N-acetylglucosaminyltransferase